MQDAYRHCAELVRAADKDRYLAALFAPAERRDALLALAAFNLEIAGVRERAREPMPGEIRLQWWREVLAGERTGEAAANPVAAALTDALARFELPAGPMLDLIEAHAFDLYDDAMPTMAALEAYARKTASVLLAQAARICGGEAPDAAEHGGVAWCLSDLLRAVARHASRRQLYVPLELLERHGARVEDVMAGMATPALHAALAELRGEACRRVAAFESALARTSAAALPAVLPVALVPGYLAVMERRGYDPFRTAVEVPQWRRQWTLWRAARRYAGAMGG